MASKLFQAIVGVGIAIGTTMACSGKTSPIDPATSDADTDASDRRIHDMRDASAHDGDHVEDATHADAHVDHDASDAELIVDASVDVILDAFCDAAWPTTKGNVGPSSCIDPTGACADAGTPLRCHAVVAPNVCSSATAVASTCVAAHWECPPSTIPVEQCWCWDEVPDGQVCSDAGPIND